jgi:glutamyl-tRNA synthetase
MHTTHVVRGDEWLPTLPFHLQLFRSLGFKPPKYLHIGPLMKMDGESKRKLSKRKDPELALTYYREAGFPVASVYEYLMTVLNSNFEDWRRANPDAPATDFKFSHKKMNPAGSLFDAAKLRDVSKNVISRMSTDEIYREVTAWAKDYDEELYRHLVADEAYTKSILAIGRGGKKPRKDFAVLADVRPYLDFFFDDWFRVTDAYPEQFAKSDIEAILGGFAASYEEADDMTVWFDKIKALAEANGFASDMKAYKENPEAYRGNVADISMFLRVAVTGRQNSPDMYAAMQVLGSERVVARIQNMIDSLK